jgi:hypothetical protein
MVLRRCVRSMAVSETGCESPKILSLLHTAPALYRDLSLAPAAGSFCNLLARLSRTPDSKRKMQNGFPGPI